MFNKKAQGLSTSTIILLVLGLVVLIALILGFVTGWQGVKKLINPSNVDDVVRDCSATCTFNSEYSFCSGERTIRSVEDDLEVKSSCLVFATAGEFEKYGVANCTQIKCKKVCENYQVDGVIGKPNTEGEYDISAYIGAPCTF